MIVNLLERDTRAQLLLAYPSALLQPVDRQQLFLVDLAHSFHGLCMSAPVLVTRNRNSPAMISNWAQPVGTLPRGIGCPKSHGKTALPGVICFRGSSKGFTSVVFLHPDCWASTPRTAIAARKIEYLILPDWWRVKGRYVLKTDV
jgi:hypothetical protein